MYEPLNSLFHPTRYRLRSLHAGEVKRYAASVALVLATAVAAAQGVAPKAGTKPAGKSLSGKATGGGKLMTREELRICLKRQDDIVAINRDIEELQSPLERDFGQLKAVAEALKVERAEVDRRLAAVRVWEAKVRAWEAEVVSYNKRSAEAQDAPRSRQDQLAEALKGDAERLQKTRGAIAAEEAQLVPPYKSAAKAYDESAIAYGAKVDNWNQRRATVAEKDMKSKETHTLWLNECANRPYLEDDEIAIKAGK